MKFKKKIDDKKIANFVKKISSAEEFRKNRSLSNAPWKYLNDNNIDSLSFEKTNEILGVMVIIKNKYVNHLTFLYVLRKYRNLGIGKKLMKYYIKNYNKKILTIHVAKKHKKTILFYSKFGFEIYKPNYKNKIIQKWKNKWSLNYSL